MASRNRLVAISLGLAFIAGCSSTSIKLSQEGQIMSTLGAQKSVRLIVNNTNAKIRTTLNAKGIDVMGVDGDRAFVSVDSKHYEILKSLHLDLEAAPMKALKRNVFENGYHTYTSMADELHQLAAKYPNLTALQDIGDSWEKTQNKANRDIWALRIGNHPEGKPQILFCGNHHAREIVTTEIVMRLAHHLLENYGKDSTITRYLDTRDIWLVPMVNPDGHIKAEKGDDWRKNTNSSLVGDTYVYPPNGPGTDLNRNYGYKWATVGADTDPESATFGGPKAFSEPETQAMRDFIKSHKFVFLMSYHSFSNLILWPWGCSDAPPPDARIPVIGKKLGELSGYTAQQSKDLYGTSGDTTDWAYGECGVLSYTTEIGSWQDSFDPPYSQMDRFWKENLPGAMYLIDLTDNPNRALQK